MKLKKREIKLMGAAIDIAIYVEKEKEGEDILEEVIGLLHRYNVIFSANSDDSMLMKINKNSGVCKIRVEEELFSLIKIAKVNSLKEGFFNVALGVVVKSWKIGFDDAKIPSEAEIAEKLLLTNPEDIILDEKDKSVYLAKKGMEIDLGAIAKGYIADSVVNYLKKQGVKAGYINLGGNFLTFGEAYHNENKNWRIGIQDPSSSRGKYLCVLTLQNKSVVTSGVYERVLEKNGKRYHHILDSKTGYPIESKIESLTIVSDKSIDGEIWTTKLFGMEIEEIMDRIANNEDIEGLVVTKKGEVFYSEDLEKFLL